MAVLDSKELRGRVHTLQTVSGGARFCVEMFAYMRAFCLDERFPPT